MQVNSITVRKIDDWMKSRLRSRAAAHGRSVEAEIRDILKRDLERDDPENYPAGMAPRPGEGIGSYLFRISRPGFDLEIPPRTVDERPQIDFE